MASKKLLGYLALVTFAAPMLVSGQITRLIASGNSLSIPYSAEQNRATLATKASFSIPGAAHTNVVDIARAPDGTLALCGASRVSDKDLREDPFIAWISPDGTTRKVVRTEDYAPSMIVAAPDGTFWTLGADLNPSASEKSGVERNASPLRHYDRSGNNVFSFGRPVTANHPLGHIAVTADRVGWFYPDKDTGTYVEISYEPGYGPSAYSIPQLPNVKTNVVSHGLAITSSGEVFISMKDEGVQTDSSVFALNRRTGEWDPVTLPRALSGEFAHLDGASGSDLAFHLPGDPVTTVRLFTPAR